MSETKDSCVKWLGKIPKEWELNRLKYLASIESGATPSKDNSSFWNGPLPWVSSMEVKRSVLLDTSLHISEEALKSCSTKLFPKGTLVMVVRSGILQHTIPVALLGKAMTVNQDIKALSFTGSMLSSYFYYFVKGNNDNLLKALLKDKSTVDNINQEYLKNLLVPVPPLAEQKRIVTYLDTRCASADIAENALIAQISLLERYRGSVIHEAVTHGIDPTVPTKPSGIEWIGDIPESWKVYRLKFFTVSDLGLMLDEKQMTNVNVHEYLANKDVQWFSINETGLSEASFPLGSEQRYQIMDGDILICEGGEVGRCAVWHGPSPHFYYQKAIHRLRVDKSIANPDFIAYQFFDKAKTTNFVEVRKGVSTIAHLPGDQLMRLKFTVPPLEEQNAIADYLDARTAAIDAVLEIKRKQLDILKRRRQSLIYEYVTGKRRVTEEA